MMTETGRVVAVEPDCLWVETIRRSTCGSCSVQKGCGHGLLNKMDSRRSHYLRVLLGEQQKNTYQVDDEVRLSIPEQVLVRGALLVYLMPLLTLLAGAMVGEHLWATDWLSFIGAATGFALGLLLVRLHAWLTRNRRDLQPVIIAPVHSEPEIIHSV